MAHNMFVLAEHYSYKQERKKGGVTLNIIGQVLKYPNLLMKVFSLMKCYAYKVLKY